MHQDFHVLYENLARLAGWLEIRNIIFGLHVKETTVSYFVCQRPGYLYIHGYAADWEDPIDTPQKTHLLFSCIFLSTVFFLLSPSSPRVWWSLSFCAEKRSSFLHESEEILCCFARKAIGRRHESTTLSWCCAAILRGNNILKVLTTNFCDTINCNSFIWVMSIKSFSQWRDSVIKWL